MVVVQMVEVDIRDDRDFGLVVQKRPAVFARFDDEPGTLGFEVGVFSSKLGHRRSDDG